MCLHSTYIYFLKTFDVEQNNFLISACYASDNVLANISPKHSSSST